MGLGRKLAIGVGGLVGVLVIGGVGAYLWASQASASTMAANYEVHRVDFPIPFPLTAAERDSLPAGANGDSVALAQAVSRGQHLVEARYGCGDCHGQNFAGGVMVDAPETIGRLLGPNLTLGTGSRTTNYTAADWDRIVRHGVKPDGTPTAMPAKDFFQMSDRELSDIVAYIRSQPPVDATVPPVALGPIGKMLVATGQFVLSADVHPSKHVLTHIVDPPTAAVDTVFGKHLAQTCIGCHGALYNGGKIIGGPPEWPPAANLTPTGLVGWSYDDFVGVMRGGKRKDGTPLREPMASMPKFAKNMTETELRAMWAYLSALPPTPTGQ